MAVSLPPGCARFPRRARPRRELGLEGIDRLGASIVACRWPGGTKVDSLADLKALDDLDLAAVGGTGFHDHRCEDLALDEDHHFRVLPADSLRRHQQHILAFGNDE